MMKDSVKLPHQQCYDAVNRVALSRGFLEYDLDIDTGTAKGDNYLGDIWRVVVKAKNSEKVLNLIIKTAPTQNTLRDEVPLDVIYNREIVAYNEVFKALREVQDAANVGPEMKFSFVRCFYASETPMKELLVFEDLKIQGFSTVGRMNRLEIEHVKLVVTSLAKFHALSFVLQKQNCNEFKRLIKKCPDFMVGLECFERFLGSSLDLAAKVIENQLFKEKIIQFKKSFLEDAREALKDGKYSVICHGDCWMNNVLFKNENGKPVEVRLIDYQILRYGPPAVDLLHFFFTSTDGELRSAHYTNCLDLYHDTLGDVLKAYSYDVKEVFPREEFDKQVKQVSKHAFISGIAVCKPFVLETEDAMNAVDVCSQEEMAPPTGAAFDRYLKKLTDIVADCVELGYV